MFGSSAIRSRARVRTGIGVVSGPAAGQARNGRNGEGAGRRSRAASEQRHGASVAIYLYLAVAAPSATGRGAPRRFGSSASCALLCSPARSCAPSSGRRGAALRRLAMFQAAGRAARANRSSAAPEFRGGVF